jgi:tRNA threonylcarbamoyladenosine biosynthesis protein TsaB
MLLGIDTCGSTGTIALARRDGQKLTLLGEVELPGKMYSALLVPRLRELLEAHNVSLQQVETVIVVNGPGGFTGVRVGLSAIKGLVEVSDTPVIAVSRLAVLAWKARLPYAALDAGRGEFYFGDYADGVQEALLLPDEIRKAGVVAGLAICEEKAALAFPEARLVASPTAADALDVAMPRYFSGDFDDAATLDGNYLRHSDAELFAKPKADASAGKTQKS